VRLHGGNVSVGSEGAGTGSKFVVTLPRAMTAADGRPETVPARSSA
jgi:signal transduction histidine kinase